MYSRYNKLLKKLKDGKTAILDGGVGTELERRGVQMDASWCGSASLNNKILTEIHLDYIKAGAEIITTNTYASSRLMLNAAGLGDSFSEINTKAIQAAKDARITAGQNDILIAGSVSHRFPIADGDKKSDPKVKISDDELFNVCKEMAMFLADNGCDFLLLEMMYQPERIKVVFEAVKEIGLPTWVGFSLRKTKDGEVVSLTDEKMILFSELLYLTKDYEFDVLGIMHTNVELITDSIRILRSFYDGPIMVYPDSGGWLSPNWDFSSVISEEYFSKKALEWQSEGAQIIGGCCGLSPEHIARLSLQD